MSQENNNTQQKVLEHINRLKEHTKDQVNFHQSVDELFEDVLPSLTSEHNHQVVARMLYPDRIIEFTVSWLDDSGELQINRGFRVQFSNAIGPYKGGLRFHPKVSVDDFKFLGFEQSFKDALTGLPMGGAKGGSDFDPKGKSNTEIKRFCEAYMTELVRYIGPDVDVPAGDIGVGARELGYLFGHYKALTGKFHGAMTGKGPSFGGSCIRTEATGFGCVYFLEHVLKQTDDTLKDKKVRISGAGNVALYAAKKCLEKHAVVQSLSDSKGVLVSESGFSMEQIDQLIELKETDHGALKDFKDRVTDPGGLSYTESGCVWSSKHGSYDVAMPAATQNEVGKEEAEQISSAGAKWVCQAANMPCTPEALEVFKNQKLTSLPSKAVNAGGVAVSGLERAQNALGMSWSAEKVDSELKQIMQQIHETCVKHGQTDEGVNYTKGANVAGFMRVYAAMKAYHG